MQQRLVEIVASGAQASGDGHQQQDGKAKVARRSGGRRERQRRRRIESKGLIQSARSGGNQRRYPRAILRRVAFIKVAQRVGIPLAEIAEALQALPEGRTPTAADWRRLSREWRAELDERIRTLTQLRNQLDGCIGCGCLSLKACPLRNARDTLAREGPGPHFRD